MHSHVTFLLRRGIVMITDGAQKLCKGTLEGHHDFHVRS